MIERRYAWYVLLLLSTINFMNYADRQVMFALYPYVQDELGFSDVQLGFLGAAFLLVHSMVSVPGGWLADHWYKRKVIALGVFLWSIATVLGAITRGFVDLFVYRALVGVGEALYHPAANAMISDYFPKHERGRAMGFFSVGMVLGGGGGMIAGTFIAEVLGWRYAFLAAGIPGFILAGLAWHLREVRLTHPGQQEAAHSEGDSEARSEAHSEGGSAAPQRGAARPPSSAHALYEANRAARGSTGAKKTTSSTGKLREPELILASRTGVREEAAWKRLFRTRTVLYNFAGGICVTFCIGGIIAWTVSFLDRYFVSPQTSRVPAVATAPLWSAAPPLAFPALALGLGALDAVGRTATLVREVAVPRAERQGGELARVSASFGIVALTAGILGSFIGGWYADRLMRRRRTGRLLVSGWSFVIGLPFVVGGLFANTVTQFLLCLFPGMFFFSCYMGPSIAILHDVTPYRLRGTVAAWYIFMVHLLGDAISPPIIGWLSGLSELRYALLLPVAMAAIGAVFFLLATRTVEADMDAADREGAAEMAAAALPGVSLPSHAGH